MKKLPSPINRDLGAKKACITDLRNSINAASKALDSGQIYTAIMILTTGTREVLNKMPKEKITKPFKG